MIYIVYGTSIYILLFLYKLETIGVRKMNWHEDFSDEEDVYSGNAQDLLDNDEISSAEFGFMHGYNDS